MIPLVCGMAQNKVTSGKNTVSFGVYEGKSWTVVINLVIRNLITNVVHQMMNEMMGLTC